MHSKGVINRDGLGWPYRRLYIATTFLQILFSAWLWITDGLQEIPKTESEEVVLMFRKEQKNVLSAAISTAGSPGSPSQDRGVTGYWEGYAHLRSRVLSLYRPPSSNPHSYSFGLTNSLATSRAPKATLQVPFFAPASHPHPFQTANPTDLKPPSDSGENSWILKTNKRTNKKTTQQNNFLLWSN